MHTSVFGEMGRRVALSWLCFEVLNPGAAAGCWVRWDFGGRSVLSLPSPCAKEALRKWRKEKRGFGGGGGGLKLSADVTMTATTQ